jgi:uncharacterized protein YjaG (DUF416 family)
MSRNMNNLNYDEQRLVEELEGLPHQLRVAFATACAERLLPAYTDFSERARMGDPKELTSILERLWVDLEGDAMTFAEVEEAIAKCMTLVLPLENKPLIAGQTAAEDAGAALCYALRCRKTGDSQEAAWAARRTYEALDDFVISREDIDTNQPGGEQQALSHPLIQAELGRQRRDLNELIGFGGQNVLGVVAPLRERAKAEARTFFGSNP